MFEPWRNALDFFYPCWRMMNGLSRTDTAIVAQPLINGLVHHGMKQGVPGQPFVEHTKPITIACKWTEECGMQGDPHQTRFILRQAAGTPDATPDNGDGLQFTIKVVVIE